MKPAKKEGRGRPATGSGKAFPCRVLPVLIEDIRAAARQDGDTIRYAAEKIIADGLRAREESAAKREIIASSGHSQNRES